MRKPTTPNVIATSDDPYRPQYPVTDWFAPETRPDLAGDYEAKTAGGHIFKRRYDGQHWRNHINGEVSNVELPWRGVMPLSYRPTEDHVVADQALQVAKKHCDTISANESLATASA